MNRKGFTFQGANVFMSRNLVPPEVFDALLDALRLNGASVFLCCDSSRNGPNDFHVISSPDHEKFDDLRSKGCNLVGPQCVLSCAKEHSALPKQGFTCCLALNGFKVLASGFNMEEKLKIEKMVTQMGGVLLTTGSADVSFVIVKNVLASKYKRALNVLKKPIVTINWLYQCWSEHRIVPRESFRVLPFAGLTISVTRIPAGERKEIEKLVVGNGGTYSPELTRKCTHLIADAPEGDKYEVSKRWGNIKVVTRKWLEQSVARRACMDEESYCVKGGSLPVNISVNSSLTTQSSIDTSFRNKRSSPVVPESSFSFNGAGNSDSELEATLSQNMSSMFSDPPVFTMDKESEYPAVQATNETNLNDCIANDSQSDEDDLYLSECRISLVGFEASELRRLLNLVNKGGGSRYVSFHNKLTHIVIGSPSEVEKKELRGLAASGVINVVRPAWLEDCDREKKEVSVQRQHIAYDLLLPKDSTNSNKESMIGSNQSKVSCVQSSAPCDKSLLDTNFGNEKSSLLGRNGEEKHGIITSLEVNARQTHKSQLSAATGQKNMKPLNSTDQNAKTNMSEAIFKGKTFCFSKSFPEDRRAEIVDWISQGGGKVIGKNVKQKAHFTIECHGVIPPPSDVLNTTFVSSHWIRSCLEDECLLDVNSHIIYSPLPCGIPLPGFENFRICVSQYDVKDRALLRNLCFVLGAKFVERLTRKVTHLLCKFTNGPKYEAACEYGTCSVTSEWLYDCVRQNEVVTSDPFRPKAVTPQDQEAGLCTVSQFPTQAARMVSGENPSQFPSQSSQDTHTPTKIGIRRISSLGEDAQQPIDYLKRVKLADDEDFKRLLSSSVNLNDSVSCVKAVGGENSKENGESSCAIADVADTIVDLLQETSKIHDQESRFNNVCDDTLFQADCSMLSENHRGTHPVMEPPKNWSSHKTIKEVSAPKVANRATYDGFSPTQTDSQVVVYEEDLSGRQMLIDRVRTRGSSSLI